MICYLTLVWDAGGCFCYYRENFVENKERLGHYLVVEWWLSRFNPQSWCVWGQQTLKDTTRASGSSHS